MYAMSTKHLRRLLEAKEQEEAKKQKNDDEGGEEDEEPLRVPVNRFAAFEGRFIAFYSQTLLPLASDPFRTMVCVFGITGYDDSIRL